MITGLAPASFELFAFALSIIGGSGLSALCVAALFALALYVFAPLESCNQKRFFYLFPFSVSFLLSILHLSISYGMLWSETTGYQSVDFLHYGLLPTMYLLGISMASLLIGAGWYLYDKYLSP